MIVLLYEPRFWEPILSGAKVHTIRRDRKRRIVPPVQLSHRGWVGVPYRSKQRVLLEGPCLQVLNIRIEYNVLVLGTLLITNPRALSAFARTDGFPNWGSMRAYWAGKLPFDGILIQWGEHPLLERLRDDQTRRPGV